MRLSQGRRPNISIGRHSINSVLNGVEYFITDVRGWLDRPAVRQDTINRELADGEFPAPWQHEARLIDIDGYAFCKDWAEQHHISDQLNGLAAVRREWLTIQGPGEMQSALVEAAGTPHFHMGINGVLEFGLRFKAPDPRKYGDLHTADIGPNWSELRHHGNYLATPTFRLYALGIGDAGFDIQADVPSGSAADGVERRVWRYQSWTNNAWHDIDFSTGMHRVAGNRARSNVSIAQSWDVPPHGPVNVRVRPRLAAGGTVYGTVSWRDTWI